MNSSYTPQPFPSQSDPGSEKIPNYLIWAILCTLCCCLPGGIVSIVYSSKVDGLVAAGYIEQARDASNKAKMWAMISGGVGFALYVLYWGFVAFIMMTADA